MLVVRVELWPHGRGGDAVKPIATMTITNGGGTSTHGDYEILTANDGVQPQDPHALFARSAKRAEVIGYPRLTAHVWELVSKSLLSLGYGKGETP